MQDIGAGYRRALEHIAHETQDKCPICDANLWGANIVKDKDTGLDRPPRFSPVCISCGYSSKTGTQLKTEQQKDADRRVKNLRINQAQNFFYQSLLTDKTQLKKTFDNFEPVNSETLKAKQIAINFAGVTVNGENKHLILIGNTGVGKTHLGIGTLNYILEKSGYQKFVYAVNYSELLNTLKMAFDNDVTKKAIAQNARKAIDRADVLMIDDLGAELGHEAKRTMATDFNVKTLTDILEARAFKPTIITSNLTGAMIIEGYGRRVMSRMTSNSEDYVVTIANTKDQRR